MDTNKKTLVFVHGYLGGSPQWAAQVEKFSADLNVITPDLPGFGLSSHLEAPETITGFADNVLDELDQAGVKQFYLVGHSMGGMIAQEIMKLEPERVDKLVLYGTGPVGLMPGRYETIEASRNRVKTEGVKATARRIAARWFVGGEDSPGYEACAAIAEMAGLQAVMAGLTAMESWSGEAELAKITVPTLVLWGDKDQSYHWPLPERLWQEIPDAGLSVVAGCSHAVHLEKPELFNAVLHDFLTG